MTQEAGPPIGANAPGEGPLAAAHLPQEAPQEKSGAPAVAPERRAVVLGREDGEPRTYEEPTLPEGGTLEGALEALLLVANDPLELRELTELLGGCSWVVVRRGLRSLQRRYVEAASGLELVEVAKGWRLMTRALYAELAERLQTVQREQRLSRAQLEVLALVAYRQPVLRADIDATRGADSSGALRALLDKGLLRVTGRADQLGKPMLYGTTRTFLERFGLKEIGKLPAPGGRATP